MVDRPHPKTSEAQLRAVRKYSKTVRNFSVHLDPDAYDYFKTNYSDSQSLSSYVKEIVLNLLTLPAADGFRHWKYNYSDLVSVRVGIPKEYVDRLEEKYQGLLLQEPKTKFRIPGVLSWAVSEALLQEKNGMPDNLTTNNKNTVRLLSDHTDKSQILFEKKFVAGGTVLHLLAGTFSDGFFLCLPNHNLFCSIPDPEDNGAEIADILVHEGLSRSYSLRIANIIKLNFQSMKAD